MIEIKKAVLKVRRQKTGELELAQEKPVREGEREGWLFEDGKEVTGGFVLGKIPDGQTGWLTFTISNTAVEENANLRMETPVTLDLYISEKPEKITAMYLFSDWWTRPAFLNSFAEIPPGTQVAFLKYADHYACLIPGVGESYKTTLAPGGEMLISLEMTAFMGGMSQIDEPVFLYVEDRNIYRAVEKAFACLAASKGIKKREDRRFPEVFRYLGWCTWNAFYQEADEEKIREKAREFKEKRVPVRWILLDDGWLCAKGSRLYDFEPDKKKFPEGFLKMKAEICRPKEISWLGVWHALGGYWGGILPGSILEREEREHLCRTANGRYLPKPQADAAFAFYRSWYKILRKEGVDFLKVDGQSAVKNYFENTAPVCRAAREIQEGLEGAATCFDGAVINCMGMSMEQILARPSSAVSRSSDDFFPDRESGFPEHLLQNAYNTLYQDMLYYCDWDMFWTDHKDSVKHSLLRGISGGPVYISDKIGRTIPEVLKPLIYLDGEILMMDRGARPAADCIFTDPRESKVLKLTNVAAYGEGKKGGGVAVFNFSSQRRCVVFSPSDVWDISHYDQYWVYDYFNQTARICGKDERIEEEIGGDGFAWYEILGAESPGTFLGLKEKYAGFTAVEDVYRSKDRMTALMKEQGKTGILSVKEPEAVYCNGTDVSECVEKKGFFYTVNLEEKSRKAMIEVVWRDQI